MAVASVQLFLKVVGMLPAIAKTKPSAFWVMLEEGTDCIKASLTGLDRVKSLK